MNGVKELGRVTMNGFAVNVCAYARRTGPDKFTASVDLELDGRTAAVTVSMAPRGANLAATLMLNRTVDMPHGASRRVFCYDPTQLSTILLRGVSPYTETLQKIVAKHRPTVFSATVAAYLTLVDVFDVNDGDVL